MLAQVPWSTKFVFHEKYKTYSCVNVDNCKYFCLRKCKWGWLERPKSTAVRREQILKQCVRKSENAF